MKKYLHQSMIAFIMIFLLITACSKNAVDDTKPANQTSSFGLLQDKIITPTCATSGCHASISDATYAQHGLVLEKSVAYNNLVGVEPKNELSKADGHLRVKAYKSLESLFYHKLNWDVSHHGGKQYGSPMPLGGTALTVGQIEFVRRWIEAGAPQTGDVVDKTLLSDTTRSITSTDDFKPMKTPQAEGLEGYQMQVEKFIIQPNFERETFTRKAVGNTVDIYVNRLKFQSRANSHHMVLYDFRDKVESSLPLMNTVRELRNPDNTLNILTAIQMSNHIFLGGGTNANQEYTFPEGTALFLPAGMTIDLNPHYFNKTIDVHYGENNVNLYTTDKSKVKYVVKTIDFNNTSLNLPPQATTTITKDFKFSSNVKIISLTSHNHKYGQRFIIKILGGDRNGEIVYESTDWEHPVVINYATPISLKKGEGLTSVVTYNNTSNKKISFGLTSEDEMDIIFGYYYED
jgi:Copper type II ascorbate-dependent monooxygenase, C-terminal domain